MGVQVRSSRWRKRRPTLHFFENRKQSALIVFTYVLNFSLKWRFKSIWEEKIQDF